MQHPASASHRRLDGFRVVAAAVLVGIATAALAWWRLGPTARGTVWAEDGGLFLRERITLGAVDSLLHPYAGYLHLVPRLLVDVAWALPVQDYARALSAGACLVVGAVGTTVFVLARDVVPQWPLRALLAAVPALLPLAPHEISGNAANLHWYMLFAAPWLFAYRARTWWASGTVAVLTAFAVLTELQTVLFLPILLLAWFPLRDASGARAWPRAVPVTIVALIGAGAQVAAALTDQRSQPSGTPAFTDVVAGWLLQPVAGIWTPDVGAAVRAVVTHGWGVVLVPVLLVAVAVVGAARRRDVARTLADPRARRRVRRRVVGSAARQRGTGTGVGAPDPGTRSRPGTALRRGVGDAPAGSGGRRGECAPRRTTGASGGTTVASSGTAGGRCPLRPRAGGLVGRRRPGRRGGGQPGPRRDTAE